jgi:hypothetical protein
MAMRFGDVANRNAASLMVEAVSHNVAPIPVTEERVQIDFLSLLATFFSHKFSIFSLLPQLQ